MRTETKTEIFRIPREWGASQLGKNEHSRNIHTMADTAPNPMNPASLITSAPRGRPTTGIFFSRKPSVVPEASAKKTERLSSPAPSSYTPPLAVHAVGRTIPRKPRRFPQITSCSTSRAERERRESRRAPSASREDPSLRTRPPRRSCPPHL